MRKHFLSSSLFFVLIGLCLYNCSEDESLDYVLNNTTSSQIENIHLDKDLNGIRIETIPFSIAQHKNELEQKLEEFSNNQLNEGFSSFSESENENNPILNGLHIIEDSVVYAEYGNKHAYTFATHRESENEYIENLVLKSNSDNDYDAYLFQYRKNNDEIVVHQLEEYQSDLLFSESTGGGCGIQATVTPCSSTEHHKGNMGSWGECTANVGPTINISFLCENDSGNGGSTYVLNNSNNFCVGCESTIPTTSTNNGSPTTGDGNDNSDVQTQESGSGSTGNGTTYAGPQETGEPDDQNLDIVTQQFLPNDPIPEEEARKRECRKIDNLLNENPEFKQRLIDLAAEAPNTTFEKGIAIDKNGNEINIPDGTAGKIDPPLNPSEKYLSIAHIHDQFGKTGIGTYSVPSLGDMSNLGYITVINNKINLSKLVYFLFTADGTYYALTIHNTSKFREFWAYHKYLYDYHSLTDEQRKVYGKILDKRAQPNSNGIYYKYYNNENGSLLNEASTNYENQLKYFLQFLEEEDGMGVSVFETDAQLSQFTQVELNEYNPNAAPNKSSCQ